LSPFNRLRFGPVLTAFFASFGALFRSRAALQLEILVLRHQLGVLQRSVKRPKLSPADRVLWAWLSSVWSGWESRVSIVKAATVIGWQRKGFGLFWSWKIRHGKRGRPAVPKRVRQLIRTLSRENPLWGAPHIHGELLKLGIIIGETSVTKYMVRHRLPPSQTWRTFLDNHLKTMVSVDFFVVPTIRFQILYVFLVHNCAGISPGQKHELGRNRHGRSLYQRGARTAISQSYDVHNTRRKNTSLLKTDGVAVDFGVGAEIRIHKRDGSETIINRVVQR